MSWRRFRAKPAEAMAAMRPLMTPENSDTKAVASSSAPYR